jgi:integrase
MGTTRTARGKGRVFSHGNSWWIDISFGGIRRRERIVPVHADKEINKKMKKQAEAVLAKRIMEIAENRFFDVKRDCKTTFAALADKYLAWAKDNHESYGISDIYFVKQLKEYFGNAMISEISREDVERYKKHRQGTGVGNSTINHELSTLRHMFNKAIKDWEHPDSKQAYLFEGRNPAERFKKLSEEKRKRYLTKGELVKLVDHILVKIATVTNGRDQKGYKRLLDFIMIAVTTGMRKSEVKSLTRGSKDIHFSDTDPMDNYIYLMGKYTKNGEPRIVYLNKISKAILSRDFDLSYEPRHLWETVRTETGLEDVTIHDFRRTFSTYLNAIGIGAFTLAAILGHKVPNFDVTSIYAQPDREKMKEAIDKLETYLVELVPVISGTWAAQSGNGVVRESAATYYNQMAYGV